MRDFEGWKSAVHHDTSDCKKDDGDCDQWCDCVCHLNRGNLDTPVQDILGMPRRAS